MMHDLGFNRPFRLRHLSLRPDDVTHPVVTVALVLISLGLGLAIAFVGVVLFASVRL